jgi:basic membrane lipoprotein Med (substrate-binding protein (PBP1-ABC) superfamily)
MIKSGKLDTGVDAATGEFLDKSLVAPEAVLTEEAKPATAEPTKAPTAVPTTEPTKEPTKAPTMAPTAAPTTAPTKVAQAAAAKITSVCLVTDVGRVNDGTFNQFAYEGMVKAAKDFDLQNKFIETQAQTDYAANINTCISEGFNAIVTVGFLIADATYDAAVANPNVYFIGVDQGYFGKPSIPKNLVGIQYREDQAGFLVGALAALMTKSGTVAGVYGINIPPVIKYRHGFEQGVRYINPKVKTLGVYIDSFTAPDRGAAAAEQLIGEGADVIFGAGGPTGSGGIKAAAAKNVLVIGVDQDEYNTTFGKGETPGADKLISSALKRVDVGVYNMLAALSGGTVQWAGGGLYILEVANDGIGFAPAHDASVPDDVTKKVQDIFDMIKSGKLDTGVDAATGEFLDKSLVAPEAVLTEEAKPEATGEATAEATP